MPPTTDSPISSNSTQKPFDVRWIYFGLWTVTCLALFWLPLSTLWRTGLGDENTSHIFLIPLITVWLLFTEKRELPGAVRHDYLAAATFALPAGVLAAWNHLANPSADLPRLTASMLALLLLVIAGFLFLFGREGGRRCWFPLAFLAFAVPIPPFLLQKFIYWLQVGSAAVAGFFFDLSGYPVLREGLIFRLPRISIEVAQECSGIRSSIALLILAVLVSHFAFRPMWKKVVFVAAGLLMMVIKNGVRIASLTLLANYINPDFLYGKLHHQGGIVFFIIGLALLIPVYQLLRRSEKGTS